MDVFGMNLFPSAYLVFNFFLILLMDLITLFGIIHRFYYTIQLTLTLFFFSYTFNKKFSVSTK